MSPEFSFSHAQENIGDFSGWPVRYQDVNSFGADEVFVARLQGLLTPAEMLVQTEFGTPKLIYPRDYPTFDDLVHVREDIKTLQLLPLKDDDCYARYKATSREELVARVEEILGGDIMALAPNEYPHDLPPDVWQGVVWMQSDTISNRLVATFIAKCLMLFGAENNDFISFRRPPLTNAKLTRPTMPGIPHVHFWTRDKSW